MLVKPKFLNIIKKEGDYKSIDEALKAYNAVMSAIEIGILNSDGVKLPNVGILKRKIRKARKINVPTVENLVEVKKRETLVLEIDDNLKFKLNKNRK